MRIWLKNIKVQICATKKSTWRIWEMLG